MSAVGFKAGCGLLAFTGVEIASFPPPFFASSSFIHGLVTFPFDGSISFTVVLLSDEEEDEVDDDDEMRDDVDDGFGRTRGFGAGDGFKEDDDDDDAR